MHWVNAALFLVLVVTGAALYLEPIGGLGRRALVEDIHVYSGLALPVPAPGGALGIVGERRSATTAALQPMDKRRPGLARAQFHPDCRGAETVPGLAVGKFNAGQKLNVSFVVGAGLVLLGTGVIMRWYHPWPLAWRTGATFVHDWLALGIGIVIIGHIWMALRDWDALRSMFVGTISRSWAARHAAAWIDGEDGPVVTDVPADPALRSGSPDPAPAVPVPTRPDRPAARR